MLWQGKNWRQFRLQTSLIGQFVHLVGVGWGKGVAGLFEPATSVTLLEYMIIWCKIQVAMYPLDHYFLDCMIDRQTD